MDSAIRKNVLSFRLIWSLSRGLCTEASATRVQDKIFNLISDGVVNALESSTAMNRKPANTESFLGEVLT